MNILATILTGVIVLTAFCTWASTPIVQYSYSKGVCIEVISSDDTHSCNNLPTKYISEWVK